MPGPDVTDKFKMRKFEGSIKRRAVLGPSDPTRLQAADSTINAKAAQEVSLKRYEDLKFWSRLSSFVQALESRPLH